MKKKILLFASLGMVCTTFFLSCESKNYTEEEQLELALETPAKVISNRQAVTLFQNDHNTRLSKIGKESTSFAEKAIHFDLTTLESYINHLEHIANTKNIPISGASFIFGVTKTGKRTVFLIPATKNHTIDYQESFTIENGEFLIFKHIDELLKPQKNSMNDENLILGTDGFISFNEAVALFNEYQNNIIQPFAKQAKRPFYTRAVWYSLKEFKDYFSYLRKQSKLHNLNISGIDVFFGVYDENPSLGLKSNAETIFMTASVQNRSIVNTKSLSFEDISSESFFFKNDEDTEIGSLTFNIGHLSPPPPPKKDW